MTIEIIPIRGLPEVRAGDDLAQLIWAALFSGGAFRTANPVDGGLPLADGDIVAVTQKVVSKAEGRIVPEGPEGKAEWVRRETRRVVARRGDLIVAETRHGFVCANAGVDASNVAEGFLSLLPEDPDASAEGIRLGLQRRTGARVGVVVTDTFGRPWRAGLVNVAIGCAGLPSVVDLRGTKDALGRVLEATIVALADEIAAATGLVMGKADGVPAAIVRGVAVEDPPAPAAALVRTPEEDLFRESPLEAIHARRPATGFAAGPVPREAVLEAVAAAGAAETSLIGPPLLFVAVGVGAARRRLLAAMAARESESLLEPGVQGSSSPERALLEAAPLVIVPCARLDGPLSLHPGRRAAGPDEDGGRPRRRGSVLLSAGLFAGAAVQNLLLALHAQRLGASWVASPILRAGAAEGLGLDRGWTPLGAVAVGRPAREAPAGSAASRSIDPTDSLRELR